MSTHTHTMLGWRSVGLVLIRVGDDGKKWAQIRGKEWKEVVRTMCCVCCDLPKDVHGYS